MKIKANRDVKWVSIKGKEIADGKVKESLVWRLGKTFWKKTNKTNKNESKVHCKVLRKI